MEQNMKILQFGRFYPPSIGGIQTVMYDVTEGLNENGINCDVLCSNDKYEFSTEKIKNYNVFRTKTLGILFSTSISPQLIIKLKQMQNNYDVIHVHLPDPLANLALFITRPKAKIILHWHSDIIKQKKLLKLYEPLQEWLLRKAYKIIATSENYINGSKYLSKYRYKTEVVQIGIDKERLSFDEKRVKEIKKKYENKKIIFSLGRMAYYKGFEYLIDSAQYLDDDYVIVIGGIGELFQKLRNKIVSQKLENKVHLVGMIPEYDLGNYYKSCDLFCLSSIEKSEAFGVVQLEAFRFGKPIVSTKIKGSGVDWVNLNLISGVVVSPKNSKEIAIAIEKVLSNEKQYAKFSHNALKRFNDLFTKKTMVESIIQLYKNTE
jgi:rhamnosyl/mannosyltransferase